MDYGICVFALRYAACGAVLEVVLHPLCSIRGPSLQCRVPCTVSFGLEPWPQSLPIDPEVRPFDHKLTQPRAHLRQVLLPSLGTPRRPTHCTSAGEPCICSRCPWDRSVFQRR